MLRPAALLILPRACIIGLGISKASIDGAAALARTRIAVRGVGSATLRVAGTEASWVAASSIRMRLVRWVTRPSASASAAALSADNAGRARLAAMAAMAREHDA